MFDKKKLTELGGRNFSIEEVKSYSDKFGLPEIVAQSIEDFFGSCDVYK